MPVANRSPELAGPNGNDAAARVAHLGPISPELALVDPELAAWARARLPDIPAARLALVGRPTATGGEVKPEQAAGSPDRGSSHRTDRLLLAAGGIVLIATFATGFLSKSLISSPRPRESAVARLAASRPATTSAVLAPLSPAAPPAVGTTTQQQPTSVASRSTRSTHLTGRSAVAPRREIPGTAPELIWARAPRSDAYRVSLYRGGQRIFTTITTASRTRIPTRWRYGGRRITLEPGTYRWVVWSLVRAGNGYRERSAIVNASIRF